MHVLHELHVHVLSDKIRVCRVCGQNDDFPLQFGPADSSLPCWCGLGVGVRNVSCFWRLGIGGSFSGDDFDDFVLEGVGPTRPWTLVIPRLPSTTIVWLQRWRGGSAALLACFRPQGPRCILFIFQGSMYCWFNIHKKASYYHKKRAYTQIKVLYVCSQNKKKCMPFKKNACNWSQHGCCYQWDG
jgi:hypothetical protein